MGINNWRKNHNYKENQTTYFYWEIKKNKRTGKLIKTTDINKIDKVINIPLDSSNKLSLENCLLFSVDYDWYDREIWLTYYFPLYEDSHNKTGSCIENLNDIKMDSRTRVLWIMEGDYAHLVQSENQKEIETDFGDNLPEPVIKFAIKEIKRMQSGAFGQKKDLKTSLRSILGEFKNRISKKVYDNELMLSYLFNDS